MYLVHEFTVCIWQIKFKFYRVFPRYPLGFLRFFFPAVDCRLYTLINPLHLFLSLKTVSENLLLLLVCFIIVYKNNCWEAGLFPGKLAATVLSNKIVLFEKVKGLFKYRRCQNAAGSLAFAVSPPTCPRQWFGGD